MRNLAIPTLFGLAALVSGCNNTANDSPPAAFSVALVGDLPYGSGPTDTAQFQAMPAFIKSINDDAEVSLVMHAGDIHSGKEYCTQAYDVSVFNQLQTLTAPLVYTPGDNEWADCHKIKEGGGAYNASSGAIDYKLDATGNQIDYAGGNPVDNLTLIRSIFFASPGKTIGGALSVHTQAQEFAAANPADAQFVENVWWIKSGVLFVAVNIPGGSNNGTDPWYGAPAMSAAQAAEVANRTGATLRWLNTAFDRASSEGATAVVILTQADMWDLDGNPPSHIAEYKQYIDSIATRSKTFGKPVLLFNGDSHVYRSDNPLQKGAACVYEPTSGATAVACSNDAYASQPNDYNVANFHRVVVHGSTTPQEWLKLLVDPNANAANGASAFGPFSWKRIVR